jgi:His-Xaa-Ser system protein HxsD
MSSFVSYKKDGNKAEMVIDTNIYDKNIVMKSAYVLLDKAYFLFKLDGNNIIVELIAKEDNKIGDIVADFADELLNVYLRDLLEKQNKIIREDIVTKAIGSSLDEKNFVSIDPNKE